MLSLIDYYTTQIDELTTKIEVLAEPWLHQIGQLDAVHGTGRISAQDVIAEIGADMCVFPPPPTWCPGPDGAPRSPSPAANAKEATPRPRQPLPVRRTRREHISASRTPSFLGARYRRLVKRMPKKKALVATGNSVLTIFHALLSDPDVSYHDLGAEYYEQRMNIRRQARNHVRGLERLGYQVAIQAINPDTGELAAPQPPDPLTQDDGASAAVRCRVPG